MGTKWGRDQNRRGPNEEGTYGGGDRKRRGANQERPKEGGPLMRGPKEGGPKAWQPKNTLYPTSIVSKFEIFSKFAEPSGHNTKILFFEQLFRFIPTFKLEVAKKLQ